jgi:hypothetical protein
MTSRFAALIDFALGCEPQNFGSSSGGCRAKNGRAVYSVNDSFGEVLTADFFSKFG